MSLKYNKIVAKFISEEMRIYETIVRQNYPKFKPRKGEMFIDYREFVSTQEGNGTFKVYCLPCSSDFDAGISEKNALEFVLEHAKQHVINCAQCNIFTHINEEKLDSKKDSKCPGCKTPYYKEEYSALTPPKKALEENHGMIYFDKPINIKLISTDDSHTKLKSGAIGKATGWNKMSNHYALMVNWEQGNVLNLLYNNDLWDLV